MRSTKPALRARAQPAQHPDLGGCLEVRTGQARVNAFGERRVYRPGAGAQGGRVVATGTPAQVAQAHDSRTAPYLADCLRERR